MNSVFIKKEELNNCVAKYFKMDLVSINDLISVIEDLDSKVEHYEEELEDLKQDIHDNYRRIPVSEQYDCERCESDYM